ncbi:MAG: PstS family phosphate ABC transporter substrate-binding protein [Planctomycetota bacterium]|nr:PstS family phosphate ABC transporter substrate-binding protein [Planctomycetota bacterium]
MKRLPVTVAMALICALATGCSVPPASGGQIADRVVPTPAGAGSAVDAATTSFDTLPPYAPVTGLTGKITSIGASTTTHLVARLAVEFRKTYPDVTLQVTASPISIGPAALLEGRADLVPMSRPLTPEEVQSFTGKYGYPPTEIKVAADALAIYVGKKNPVPGLTLGQLDEIFSQAQRIGGISIETWGQVGLTDEWADLPISLYGYGPEEGAHQIFRRQVLHDTPFRLSLRAEGGGSSIVQGVAANPGAIGFASIFFSCKGVRVVPLAGADGRFYAPTAENVLSLQYPLTRFLYICVNKPPRQPFGGPAAEFLRFLLSREGQEIVADRGNFPLDAATVNEGRRRLAE